MKKLSNPNPPKDVITKLTSLLNQTGEAHHKAFISTNGNDEHWAKWYAEYLINHHIEQLLKVQISTQKLEQLIQKANKKLLSESKKSTWQKYYAQHLTNHFFINNVK